jgi:CheY-like chemotaxis protein
MRVFILDDDPGRHAIFEGFLKGHAIVQAHNYAQAVTLLKKKVQFDLAYLDHDLGDWVETEPGGRLVEMTGWHVARFITTTLPERKRPKMIIVHSWNVFGAKRMVELLTDAGLKAFPQPFTPKMQMALGL